MISTQYHREHVGISTQYHREHVRISTQYHREHVGIRMWVAAGSNPSETNTAVVLNYKWFSSYL